MTVQVEHAAVLPAPIEDVWSFISDPEKRAGAISVVERYELDAPETGAATWYISLPVPVIGGTLAVETEVRNEDPPTGVTFVGRSSAMRVQGEHELESVDGGTRLTNRFVVDGRIPGVERFFEQRLEVELRNLLEAIVMDLGLSADDVEVLE